MNNPDTFGDPSKWKSPFSTTTKLLRNLKILNAVGPPGFPRNILIRQEEEEARKANGGDSPDYSDAEGGLTDDEEEEDNKKYEFLNDASVLALIKISCRGIKPNVVCSILFHDYMVVNVVDPQMAVDPKQYLAKQNPRVQRFYAALHALLVHERRLRIAGAGDDDELYKLQRQHCYLQQCQVKELYEVCTIGIQFDRT
jgi:hypothetical protein